MNSIYVTVTTQNRYDLGEQQLAKTKAKLDFTTSAHLFVEFRNKYLEGNSNIIELVLETKVHKTFGFVSLIKVEWP